MAEEPEYAGDVYRERAELVALLASRFPSVIWRNDADPDWPIIYIETPEGQLSWHLNFTDMDLFDHVPRVNTNQWDGHSTAEKYRRVRRLVSR
jgi:hypothetical protein